MITTRRFLLLAAAAWAVLAPGAARAWGPTGHRIVGRIAEYHLSDEATAAVEALLGVETLARVAVWADDMRSDPAWEKGDQWRWHFFSIDDGEALETTARDPKGDALLTLETSIATLRNAGASPADRAAALKWLVHLVGDIHQPLHIGRRADRGGNEIIVTWQGDKISNLHSVWDSEIINDSRLSFSEYAEVLRKVPSAQVAEWQKATIADWLRESIALRPQVYDIGNARLGYPYTFKVLPILERRLQQAGVRLAGVLNEVFKPAATAEKP